MMASYATLINKADEDEKKIGEKRNPLSESLLGKQDEYIKFSEEDSGDTQTQNNQATAGGMGTKTKWFIVIVLSIVALSWGIWTAIGVFVLGVIMINVLSSK